MEIAMKRIIFATACFFGFFSAASASPDPWYRGGRIADVEVEMRSTFPSGSCLVGTFMSSSVSALGIQGIRVRPDAEFWFHHAHDHNPRSTPWDINPDATRYLLRNIKPALRDEVLSRLPENTQWVIYTGSDLIRRFGYRSC